MDRHRAGNQHSVNLRIVYHLTEGSGTDGEACRKHGGAREVRIFAPYLFNRRM